MNTIQKRSIKSLKTIILDEVSLIDNEDILFLRKLLFKIDKEIFKTDFIYLKSRLYDLQKTLSLQIDELKFSNHELKICESKLKEQLKKINYISKNFELLFELYEDKATSFIEVDDIPF